MTKLEEVFEYFDSSNDAYFIGMISTELILLAEKTLNLIFSNTYKEFLKKYGSADIECIELFGITDSSFDAEVPDAIGMTLFERENNNLPNQYILVYADDDFYYALDTSISTRENENPVVSLSYGDLQNPVETVAESYEDFLYKIFIRQE